VSLYRLVERLLALTPVDVVREVLDLADVRPSAVDAGHDDVGSTVRGGQLLRRRLFCLDELEDEQLEVLTRQVGEIALQPVESHASSLGTRSESKERILGYPGYCLPEI